MLAGIIFLTYYLFRFINYIFIFENSLEDAIETFNNSAKTLDEISKINLFFESPELRPILEKVKGDIAMCKISTQKIVQKFTALSKQKYVIIEEEDGE